MLKWTVLWPSDHISILWRGLAFQEVPYMGSPLRDIPGMKVAVEMVGSFGFQNS